MDFDPVIFAVFKADGKKPFFLTFSQQRAAAKASEIEGYVLPWKLEEELND